MAAELATALAALVALIVGAFYVFDGLVILSGGFFGEPPTETFLKSTFRKSIAVMLMVLGVVVAASVPVYSYGRRHDWHWPRRAVGTVAVVVAFAVVMMAVSLVVASVPTRSPDVRPPLIPAAPG